MSGVVGSTWTKGERVGLVTGLGNLVIEDKSSSFQRRNMFAYILGVGLGKQRQETQACAWQL